MNLGIKKSIAILFVSLFIHSSTSMTARAQAPPETPRGFVGRWNAEGSRFAVGAGGAKSVDAGIRMLESGGNAADAAAAALLALTVTDSASVCFGGEVPILYYDAATKTVEVIAGQGAAPRLATLERFRDRPDGIPAKGVESATVPALLDAVLVLLERRGTMTFAQVVEPTRALLAEGKRTWHADLARTIDRLILAESAGPPGRSPGLRRVADCFYRGPIAQEIDAWMRENNGLLRSIDLASHVTRIEEPVSVAYRDWTIQKCGAWTQGPMLLQTMAMLEATPMRSLPRESADSVHRIVETMKLALADRDSFLADPIFESVPLKQMLAPKYLEMRERLIDPARASTVRLPGDPRRVSARLAPADDPVEVGRPPEPSNDTSTCVTVDPQGNVVAATPSGWSGVVAGSTGVWMGSRLQSFNLWPKHPNRLEPGKRPRITLTPTIVLDEQRRPVVAVSIAGGDNQDQLAVQLLVDLLDRGADPATAVRAPRFLSDHLIGSFRQTEPALGKLRIDPGFGEETLATLKARGHVLEVKAGPLASAPVVLKIIRGEEGPARFQVAGDPATGRHVDAR